MISKVTHDIIDLINGKETLKEQKEVLETLHRMIWHIMDMVVNHDGGDRRVSVPNMMKSERTSKLELHSI